MTYRDLEIETRQCCYESGAGVPVNQHYIREDFFQHTFDSEQNIRCDIKKCLSILHNVQIIIRDDSEGIQDLIQHPSMLSRYTDDGLKAGAFF